MQQATDKALQARLDLVFERIECPKFLKNDGLGNEVGFWIFDYSPKSELIVRDFLNQLTDKLRKHNRQFVHINVFKVLIDMLKARDLLARVFAREKQVGADELRKILAGPLSQDKIAKFMTEQTINQENLDFLLLSGLGNAWPLVRGHELLSALQGVMGNAPLILFYPGSYSGRDLQPFGMIESRHYYRAFKLVPEDGKSTSHHNV